MALFRTALFLFAILGFSSYLLASDEYPASAGDNGQSGAISSDDEVIVTPAPEMVPEADEDELLDMSE